MSVQDAMDSPISSKYESNKEGEDAVEYPRISTTGMLCKALCGATKPTKGRGICLYYLHKMYNVAFATYCLATLTLELVIMKDCSDDLNRLIRDWGMIITHIMGCVKGILLYRNEEKFKMFDDTLRKENLSYNGDLKPTPFTIITDGKRFIDYLGYTLIPIAAGVGICGYMASVLKLQQAIAEGSFPGNITCDQFMPYPCYVFFEADSILGCHLMLILYCFGLVLWIFPIIGFDLVFAAMIVTVTVNFQIIGAAFNSTRERSLQQLGYSPDKRAFRDEEIRGLNKQMLEEITKATAHFQSILRVCTEIENIFGMVILFQMGGSLIVTSALLCLSATGDLTLAESVSTLQFYCAMTIELACFCYFGNELTQAYEELSHRIYDSNWLSASLPYKKHILITMSRLQIPVYVTIGKLSPLTLATLLSVVQASFKVLALYRSISE